jgi:formylglycine-generating enzyme required for sulfatase activity/energy-coupling factor transporter ATP-binding protein EcfA2
MARKDLQSALAKHEVVVVCGGDILRQFGLTNATRWPDSYVSSVAKQSAFPSGSRRRVFDVFEWMAHREGARSVVSSIVETYRDIRNISPALQALFATRQRLTVSVWYDAAVEAAMTAALLHPPHVVVSNADARYMGEDGRDALICLLGKADSPDSLIISDSAYRERLDPRQLIHRMLSGQLAMSNILFVGFGWSDCFNFEEFYSLFMSIPSDRHARRNFVICDSAPDEALATRLTDRDLDIIVTGDPAAYLLELCNQVFVQQQGLTVQRRTTVPRRDDTPYRYLQSYTSEDAHLFFGRSQVVDQVVRYVHAHRCFLLIGASGVGKTSLLRAGVGPELTRRGFQFVWMRLLPTPRAAIIKVADVPDVDGEPGRWLDVARQLLNKGSPATLILVFDQLEEFFSDISESVRRQFWQDVGDCRLANPDIRLIFSIRQDAMYRFNEAFPDLARPFDAVYQVSSLAAEDREEAIRQPARLCGAEWSDELISLLLGDLALIDGETAHLSIAITILWERRGEGTDDVATYRALGGVKGILEEYLWGAIAKLPDSDRVTRVLETFVSPERRRVQLTVPEVTADLGESGAAGEEQVTQVCQALVKLRLLRPVDNQDGVFELAHDILAASLAARISESDMRAKVARRALREAQQEYAAARRLPRRDAYRALFDSLSPSRLTADDQLFLAVAAAAVGEPLDQMLKELSDRGVQPLQVFETILLSQTLWGVHEVLSWIEYEMPKGLPHLLDQLRLDTRPSVRLHLLDLLAKLPGAERLRSDLEAPKLDVTIPAGEFETGYARGFNLVRKDLLMPVQTVYLDEYVIDRFPVTERDYAKFVLDTGYPAPPSWPDGVPPRARAYHPVTDVTWFDAVSYARWCNKRLPTEAEWEKAAYWDPLTASKRPYPWGDVFDPANANYFGTGIGTTSPIGEYSPFGDSAYGVSDMGGNVFEWCLDDAEFPPVPFSGARNPCRRIDQNNASKITRGGSYGGPAPQLHCAWREYTRTPVGSDVYIGFRCVRAPHHPRPD